jgi:hypothetical protein
MEFIFFLRGHSDSLFSLALARWSPEAWRRFLNLNKTFIALKACE